MKRTVFAVLIALLLALPVWAQVKLLHEFTGGAEDGRAVHGSLAIFGTTLFGMTWCGGDSDKGTIFKIETDGTGFTLLHEFAGGINDGANPHGSLIVSGSTLFGMTCFGGDSGVGWGTIFKMQIDGSGFELLHRFDSMVGHGAFPVGALVLSDSTLFGMTPKNDTRSGDDSTSGTVFKIKTDGSGFELLRGFGDTDPGRRPRGSLILSGSTLYGMSSRNGDPACPWCGALFRLQTDGSGFSDLHLFQDGFFWGTDANTALLCSGTTLYGLTRQGGESNNGTIFKIQADGSGFSLLHEFTGSAADDGDTPVGSLILSGSALFGMSGSSHGDHYGAIFKLQTDGTGFSVLHKFAGSPNDGKYPRGSLALSGLTLFGMTPYGGSHDRGVIFSFPLASISVTSPHGGEIWSTGDSHEITWSSSGAIGSVKIDYSVDNGGHWLTVIAGTGNDGSHSWTVPDACSADCLVRIGAVEDALIRDASAAVFTIQPLRLDLQVEQRELRSLSQLRYCAAIHFLVGNAAGVDHYVVLRRQGAGEASESLRTIHPEDLMDNQFQMLDRDLAQGIAYTYWIEAYDPVNHLIGISEKRTLISW